MSTWFNGSVFRAIWMLYTLLLYAQQECMQVWACVFFNHCLLLQPAVYYLFLHMMFFFVPVLRWKSFCNPEVPTYVRIAGHHQKNTMSMYRPSSGITCCYLNEAACSDVKCAPWWILKCACIHFILWMKEQCIFVATCLLIFHGLLEASRKCGKFLIVTSRICGNN